MTLRIKYLLLFTLFAASCSNTKYLPQGEKLYTGAEVKIEDKDLKKKEAKALSTELKSLVRPKPNGSILGLRVKLWIYNKTKARKNFIQRFLSKYGEPPVFASQVNLEKNSQIMQNRLQNISYFQAQVSGDTVGKKKTAKAVFTALPGPGYKIRKVIFPPGTGNLDTAIVGVSKETVLKVGDKYNLDVIKNERLRIDARLKEEGFYYFAPEDLIIRVDSTIENHQVDMYVEVKNTTPDKAKRIYTINNIYVYPNYTLRDTSLKLDSAVKYRWYNVIDPRRTVRPFTFKNTVLLRPGEVYNRTEHNKSLSRFIDLGPFKYVKNRFEDVSQDSSKLDVYYFLTKLPKKSLQFEILGRTTSANYNGTQVNVSWRNRNTFKGAELLTVTLFGSTDGQVAGKNGGYALSQIGIQTTLSWPRFISPWNFKSDNSFIPRTNLTLGYSLVRRSQLYTLNSFSGSFGYSWKENLHRQHELNLINITYVKPASVSVIYTDSISKTRNPALKHVIDPQFTWGPSYSYTYTNTTETYRTNTMYYNSRLSLSNNIYGLLTGADTLAGKEKKLFGSIFNQYVKLENEIRYYHKTGANSQIASRLIVSAGLPYGNSTIMPYSQQFFIGGSNSLRGFRARSLGPGTVNPNQFAGDDTFLADQSGDIKIEGTVEYRPKLFSIVYGALFLDAGNIWNMRTHAGQEGGTFGKDFLNQLAVDAGAGLRIDASILVLRLDLGFPIRKPWLPEGQRWVLNDVKFGSGQWRSDNLVFNLAIGYPF
jgi:outer membrane protein insertion porin family